MTPVSKPEVFTSYAQNFEDVVLWRALQHVPQGFYIDIGAQHPVLDSVSKAFYEHGWRGIHVEPVPHYADLIRKDRPDEEVLQVALSDKEGTLDLHVIENSGLTTAVKAFADLHETEHGFAHTTIQTPMRTIKTTLASLAGRDVHWLKIDVEGLEEQVLRGWDSQSLRPWVIVIEATIPMSVELSYEGADRILRDADYEFVYFDGLNRFYVAAEHSELAAALRIPPNVFDEAELSGLSGTWCRGAVARVRAEMQTAIDQLSASHAQAESHARHTESQARNAEVRANEAAARAGQAAAQAAQADARAHQAEAWAKLAEERSVQLELRATQAEAQIRAAERTPMRRLVSAFRNGRVISGVKRRVKSALHVAAAGIRRYPLLSRGARFVLGLVPPLKRRLGAVLDGSRAAAHTQTFDDLSPDAAVVARQLQQSQRGPENT